MVEWYWLGITLLLGIALARVESWAAFGTGFVSALIAGFLFSIWYGHYQLKQNKIKVVTQEDIDAEVGAALRRKQTNDDSETPAN